MKRIREFFTVPNIYSTGVLVLLIVWSIFNYPRIIELEDGLLRFWLTVLISFLIFFRPKDESPEKTLGRLSNAVCSLRERSFLFALLSVAAMFMVILGKFLPFHILEWTGLLLLAALCFLVARPVERAADSLLALFVLFWANPLPAQIFTPLQMTMQQASVSASEWLLQALNQRVWADGMVLKTGASIYEIPQWCSGMRTATTVFLLGMGLVILKRFSLSHGILLTLFAVLQAFILNVIRISIVVKLAPYMSDPTGYSVLHDTSGVVVLCTVLLVWIEATAWKGRSGHVYRQSKEFEKRTGEVTSQLPPFWRVLLYRKRLVSVVFLVVLIGSFFAFRSRPYHRAQMLKDVAESLRDSGDIESAYRCAAEVCKLVPDDTDWDFTRVRMLVLRGKYAETLQELEKFNSLVKPTMKTPDGEFPDTRTLEIKILRAYCLIGLKRPKEAEAIAGGFPPWEKHRNPIVAMILAEIAFYADRPDEVAANVVKAANCQPNIKRIRSLYPYLRRHKLWNAIAESCSVRPPFDNADECFSAGEALMNAGDMAKAASLALQATARWPHDPRGLDLLQYFSFGKDNAEWEERFADHFLRCAAESADPDRLFALIERSFQLSRPDLAWLALNRIQALDPAHPALFLVPAYYGDVWFAFHKRYLAMSGPVPPDKISLKGLYLIGTSLAAWQESCARIPHGKAFAAPDPTRFRKQMLSSAIAELRKREQNGTISRTMRYELAKALEMSGNPQDAVGYLNSVADTAPEETQMSRILVAEILERAGRWQDVYEILKDYASDESPALMPLLKLCRAQINLKLNLAAEHTARKAVNLSPRSSIAAGTLAETLYINNSPEEALQALKEHQSLHDKVLVPMTARLLLATERFQKMRQYCNANFMPAPPIPQETVQKQYLPPAELSLLWHYVCMPSADDFKRQAGVYRRGLSLSSNPFLKDMAHFWLKSYDSRCSVETSDPAAWTSCGRNNIEKATALNHLALLLCNSGKFREARAAAAMAVEYMPDSPVLRRILISLSGADMDVIHSARLACPRDSEIWLAELVAELTGKRQPPSPASGGAPVKTDGDWAVDFITRSVKEDSFTAGAMARAADFLLRNGFTPAACIAARDAVARAEMLLPVHFVGMRCAITARDREFLLDCTRKAIASSLNPPHVLYRKLVEIRTADGVLKNDAEMIEALRRLMLAEPENTLWTQMMGHLRFKRGGGDIIDAAHQTAAAIDAGATNVPTFLVAAESFRTLGDNVKAVEILKQGLKAHPDEIALLNNLVHTLASVEDPPLRPFDTDDVAQGTDSGATLSAKQARQDALALIPELLKKGRGNPRILDTAAYTYVQCDRLKEAENTMKELLPQIGTNHVLKFRSGLLQAKIALRRDNTKAAQAFLQEIMSGIHGIPDADILSASRLLAEMQLAAPRGRKLSITNQPVYR